MMAKLSNAENTPTCARRGQKRGFGPTGLLDSDVLVRPAWSGLNYPDGQA